MGRLLALVSVVAISTAAWRASSSKRSAPAARVEAARESAPAVEAEAAPPPSVARRLWQPLAAPVAEETPSGVSGIVVTDRGEPAAGMVVVIEPPNHGWHAVRKSDASGGFRFDVPPGQYQLRTLNLSAEVLELELTRAERLEGLELRLAPDVPSPVESGDVVDQLDRCPDDPRDDDDGCPDRVYE